MPPANLFFSALTTSILSLCAHAARALTFFADAKESKQRTLFVRSFSAEFFLALMGEEKTAGRNRFRQSVLSAVSIRVRHSAQKQKNTKR